MLKNTSLIDKVFIAGLVAISSLLMFSSLFGFGLLNASATNTVSANVVVSSFCYFTMSNTLINFGSQTPGVTSPSNVLTFTDTVGNIATNVEIQGILPQGNWISSSPSGYSFYEANTLWGTTSTPTTPLTSSLVATVEVFPTGAPNSIYMAVSIPDQQYAATYNSVVSFTSSC